MRETRETVTPIAASTATHKTMISASFGFDSPRFCGICTGSLYMVTSFVRLPSLAVELSQDRV